MGLEVFADVDLAKRTDEEKEEEEDDDDRDIGDDDDGDDDDTNKKFESAEVVLVYNERIEVVAGVDSDVVVDGDE